MVPSVLDSLTTPISAPKSLQPPRASSQRNLQIFKHNPLKIPIPWKSVASVQSSIVPGDISRSNRREAFKRFQGLLLWGYYFVLCSGVTYMENASVGLIVEMWLVGLLVVEVVI